MYRVWGRICWDYFWIELINLSSSCGEEKKKELIAEMGELELCGIFVLLIN